MFKWGSGRLSRRLGDSAVGDATRNSPQWLRWGDRQRTVPVSPLTIQSDLRQHRCQVKIKEQRSLPAAVSEIRGREIFHLFETYSRSFHNVTSSCNAFNGITTEWWQEKKHWSSTCETSHKVGAIGGSFRGLSVRSFDCCCGRSLRKMTFASGDRCHRDAPTSGRRWYSVHQEKPEGPEIAGAPPLSPVLHPSPRLLAGCQRNFLKQNCKRKFCWRLHFMDAILNQWDFPIPRH